MYSISTIEFTQEFWEIIGISKLCEKEVDVVALWCCLSTLWYSDDEINRKLLYQIPTYNLIHQV